MRGPAAPRSIHGPSRCAGTTIHHGGHASMDHSFASAFVLLLLVLSAVAVEMMLAGLKRYFFAG